MFFASATQDAIATVRSTTDVNSSKTSSGVFSSFASPRASAIARSQRNFSPLESIEYGLIQLGGELNPTVLNRRMISFIGIFSGKASRTDCDSGQLNPVNSELPYTRRATELFPLPDGPTISPICQFSDSVGGSSSSKRCCAFFCNGTSNMPSI